MIIYFLKRKNKMKKLILTLVALVAGTSAFANGVVFGPAKPPVKEGTGTFKAQSLGYEVKSVNDIKMFLHEEVRKAYEIKERQVDSIRPGLMRDAERYFILQQIDMLWREHLQAMEALRESIGLRGYGQKDPLIEYKQEGYEMFLEMMIDIRRNVVYSLFQFQSQGQPQAVASE
jgi:preprotein translocase subunit SecA